MEKKPTRKISEVEKRSDGDDVKPNEILFISHERSKSWLQKALFNDPTETDKCYLKQKSVDFPRVRRISTTDANALPAPARRYSVDSHSVGSSALEAQHFQHALAHGAFDSEAKKSRRERKKSFDRTRRHYVNGMA